MNKRRNRRKRKKLIITLTAALVLLFIAILITKGSSQDNNSNNTETPSTSKPSGEVKESDNSKNDKIAKISVTPENYTTASGETINLDTFTVKAEYKSGKSEDIKENLTFSTDNSIISIDDNNAVISKDALTGDMCQLTVNYNGMTANSTIKVFNNLKDNINEDNVITNSDAYDMVVNKSRNLPSNYVPIDLVKLDDVPTTLKNPEVNQLRKAAHDALKELFAKAKEEKSFELYARSGYRSYNTQKDLYSAYVASKGQAAADKFSAKPGQSEHQSGLAIDITCKAMNYQLETTFFDTEEGKWVAENAYRFGFIIRYPKGKEEITGYQYEPWHLRYVGLTLAKEVYDSKLTLEEYFEQ